MTVERPSGDLGRKLRDARERKGVSLRQISNTTKIAIGVLDGLERNDISKLPGGIFGRAFVRSFATEVGLDPEATIQEFNAQFRDEFVAAGHPPSDRIEDNDALESKRRIARTFLGLFAIGIPVAAVIAYFEFAGGRQQVADTASPTPAAVTAAASDGATPPADAPATRAHFPQTVSDSGSPSPAVATEGPAADRPLGDRMVVTLAVTRDCWVSAAVDGRKQIERVLKPGDERSLDVQNELVLNVGDAGALTMTINGVEARSLGKSGEVVTVRLTPASARTYLPAR